MDAKKIGINGIAGRIGKFTAYELIDIRQAIGAVNDLASTDAIVESLSHRDSVHGRLNWRVEKIGEDEILIGPNKVKVFHQKNPADIEWGPDIYIVDECTGLFTKKVDAEKHAAHAPNLETVLLAAPCDEAIVKTLVMGANHTNYVKGIDKVVSNGSCTTKSLVMPMQVLLDNGVTIYAVLMDTTHAATNTQKPLDFMAAYGALDCIISAKTGAAKATGEVIGTLKGKMDGFAMRVPTRDGSFANVYCLAEAPNLSVSYLNSLLEGAVTDPRYLGRLAIFSGREIATPDILGNASSSIMALSKTKSILVPLKGIINPTNQVALVGIVSGYDNERGPARDLALLTQYVMQ